MRHGYYWVAGEEGDGGAGGAGGAGLAGGFGMYSGPVWPQPASKPKTTAAVPILRVNEDFTIRITV
jgi:hypothetical protein